MAAGPYENDKKEKLQERLVEFLMEIAKRSTNQNVFITPVTKYEDLHRLHDDGTWGIEKFAECMSCFQSVLILITLAESSLDKEMDRYGIQIFHIGGVNSL